MAETASRFFTVLVVGDNPEELMKKYDSNLKVEKYIKYKYLDAEKLHKNSIKLLTEVTSKYKDLGLSKFQIDALDEKLKSVKNMSPFEYYQMITYGMSYDDEGNAWSEVNPDGKYASYQKGNYFSIPLITKNGKEVTSALVKEVNWHLLHKSQCDLYELVWDLVKGNKKPENEEEEKIFRNMSPREAYFENFKNKDEYVIRNSSYWNYAYLDENGWQDLDSSKMKDSEWIATFYDKFVNPLDGNQRVTIFEFTRNLDDITD